jgi:hypothetical protein
MQCSAGVSGIGHVGSYLNEDLCQPEDVGVEVKADDSLLPAASRRSGRCFVRQRPAHVINIKIECLSHLRQVLAGLDVLPKCLGANSFDRRPAEADVGRHAHRRLRVVMRTPTHRDVFGPLHPPDERFGDWRQQELIVRHGNEAKVRIKTRIPLHLKQQLPARANEGTVMRKGIGRPVLITQAINNDA